MVSDVSRCVLDVAKVQTRDSDRHIRSFAKEHEWNYAAKPLCYCSTLCDDDARDALEGMPCSDLISGEDELGWTT